MATCAAYAIALLPTSCSLRPIGYAPPLLLRSPHAADERFLGFGADCGASFRRAASRPSPSAARPEAGAVFVVTRNRIGQSSLFGPAPQSAYDSARPTTASSFAHRRCRTRRDRGKACQGTALRFRHLGRRARTGLDAGRRPAEHDDVADAPDQALSALPNGRGLPGLLAAVCRVRRARAPAVPLPAFAPSSREPCPPPASRWHR